MPRLGAYTCIRQALTPRYGRSFDFVELKEDIPSDSLWESPQKLGKAEWSDSLWESPQKLGKAERAGSRDMKIGLVKL
jgi:hypothetical protein